MGHKAGAQAADIPIPGSMALQTAKYVVSPAARHIISSVTSRQHDSPIVHAGAG